MNYNSFDNYDDLSFGFDVDDVAVVPQMSAVAVNDDAISTMMYGSAAGRSLLDLFEFGAPLTEEPKISVPTIHPMDALHLDAVPDLDFAVPEFSDAPLPASMPASIPALGDFIPNALPEFILESDTESDMDAAVPTFPVRAKGVVSPMATKASLASGPTMRKTATKRSRSSAGASGHGYGRSAFAYADDWESDDGESDDEYVAPRRGRRVSRRPSSKSAVAFEESDNLTREERVARWLEKKKRRVFKKTVRYESRKQYADKRPRIKGRFVAPEIYAEYMAQQAAAQVVPSC